MRSFLVVIFVAIGMLVLGCQPAPKVAQGTVIAVDNERETMQIADKSASGANLEFSLKGAEMGTAARKGDTVRVAYEERDGRLTATRVMKVVKEEH